MGLELNQVIGPGTNEELIDWPHRVVAIDSKRDLALIISLPRKRKNGHVVSYMTGTVERRLSELAGGVDSGSLLVEKNPNPAFWALDDKDYAAAAPTQKEKLKRIGRQQERDKNWEAISILVGQHSGPELALALPTLRNAILERAIAVKADAVTIYRLLHLYLANGCIKNGLMPRTERCGAAGATREQRRSLGRKTKAFKNGKAPTSSFPLSELDKERLARGYALIKPTLSPKTAYWHTCAAFWSTHARSAEGDLVVKLLKPYKRPSMRQFMAWGERLNDRGSRLARIGVSTDSTHQGGSTQELTTAVGQLAMFDATSTDIYLTSIFSRLRRLPPMTRSIIKEVRSSAYIGFYVGWENPSPSTALQAIHCSAIDKADICARFGIAIKKGDWPGILCRRFLVDNGEMRAAQASAAAKQLCFGIEFTPTYSGESKGDVESQHATDHRCFDNTIEGATQGKPRERGEPHASDAALWNYYEYMQEFIRYLIDYNNEEVPDRAPLAMKQAGIRPTRINVLKWLRDHNERADIPFEPDQLTALALPEWPAVIQYNGIVLKTEDGTRNIPGVRFNSAALRLDHRFKLANATRTVVPVKVRRTTDGLGEVWMPTSNGLIRVPNVSSDAELCRQGTLMDVVDNMAVESAYHDDSREARDQRDMEKALRKDATTAAAAEEKKKELANLAKKPSKAASRAGMRQNREDEKKAVAEFHAPTKSPAAIEVQADPAQQLAIGQTAADLAMVAFLARKRGGATSGSS